MKGSERICEPGSHHRPAIPHHRGERLRPDAHPTDQRERGQPESQLTRRRSEMTMEPTCPPAIPPRTAPRLQKRSAMKKCLSSFIVLLSLFVALSAAPQAQADVTLPKVLSSHMVLQRDRPLPIWGWAAPDEEVAVKFDEATAAAKADAQGNWKVVLPAMKADGKAHAMTI